MLQATVRTTRKLVIGVIGVSVVAVGVAMLVLPGPAFVVIPTGLAILGLEFAWARRWLARVKEYGARAVDSVRDARPPRS